MKTVGVSRFGGPEALRVFEVPEPHAGPGQVRVRVHAATVNPGDRYLRIGALGATSPVPPYVPGMEAAGVLDEIGSGTVTDLRPGDRVMAVAMPNGPEGGAYAQFPERRGRHRGARRGLDSRHQRAGRVLHVLRAGPQGSFARPERPGVCLSDRQPVQIL